MGNAGKVLGSINYQVIHNIYVAIRKLEAMLRRSQPGHSRQQQRKNKDMARINTRIEIPRSPDQMIKLGQDIAVEDARLGEASPLRQLEWTNALQEDGILKEATRLQADVEKYSALAEAAYQARKLSVAKLSKLVRRSRDILKGIHADELKQLTAYGFEVSDSPRRKKKSVAAKAKTAAARSETETTATADSAVLSN